MGMSVHEGSDDATLRKYLLGELPEPLRLALEERLIGDHDLFERLGPVEDDLIEEYLEGSLPDAERPAFESHLLARPEARQQLEVLRLLKQRDSGVRQPGSKASVFRSWRMWAPVAAVAVLAAGNVLWAVGAARSARQVEQLRAEGRSAADELRRSSQREEQLTDMIETLRRQAEAVAGSATPTFVLAKRLLRSDGSLTRIAVPRGAQAVRLVLALPDGSHPSYRVAVHDPDGEEVWAQSRLIAERGAAGQSIAVVLPAQVLSRGDYQARVSGMTPSRAPEPVATFAFRVASR
jgi:hypothetical protein